MSLTIDEKKDDYVKVTWPVKLCEFLARCYHSDQFRIDNVNNVIFSMKLELGSSLSNPTLNLSVQKSNLKINHAFVNVTIESVSIKQSRFWSSSCYFKNINIPRNTMVERIIHKNRNEETLHKVYELDITCEIQWTNYEKSSLHNHPCNEIERFYNSEELSDVTIIVDQVRIPAHKVILAAHSEVFAKMLQSEMKEAKNNEINIEDLDPEIILEMLHYCYKGTLKTTNNVQIVLQVLKVADIYQIIKLKDFCEHRLMIEISSDNVLDIIDVADDSNAVDLRQEAIEFIAEHYETVFASDKFKELFFRKQELMFEVVHALSNNRWAFNFQ
ncbi:hypothetical protein KQX54_018120 [Cotesia glomerata]|uniref:BTB domain-containing protein n=1 Tax=Cotesia glomerata TaxID=32391 RepID=A0AAV7J057_COTGL|nr:hypothetical protein KQX54_018120 [Cotesia glomerata]